MYVRATRDFTYTEDLKVKDGQVFQLRGLMNDGLLLKHGIVAAIDPQPDSEALKKFPRCGECGARFSEVWQRERCGRSHELTEEESLTERLPERTQVPVDPNSRAGRIMMRRRLPTGIGTPTTAR